jgi:hypothetical protein
VHDVHSSVFTYSRAVAEDDDRVGVGRVEFSMTPLPASSSEKSVFVAGLYT